MDDQPGTLVNDAELDRWVTRLRTDGRCLRLGVPVKPAVLPRSRALRKRLEAAAQADPKVRVALDAAIEAERIRPGKIIRRHFADSEIRIY